ncbi:MAG: hypothetical protein IKZ02_00150, partial [Alphaproteobacteria bacterium]|nr:hypothetical protein [Alphaproteobacteria bacterium]
TGYDVDGTTINYSGNMNVNNDLYIPSCDLNVEGTLNIDATVVVNNLTVNSDNGISILCKDSCEIEASGDVYGEAAPLYEYDSFVVKGKISAENITAIGDYALVVTGGEIEAQGNVTGLGSYTGIGIYKNGTIYAGGDVVGDGTYGIYNSGVMWAQNVSATSTDNEGLFNSGEIIAEQLIQGSTYGWAADIGMDGIRNTESGIMIAPTISYCKTINNEGTISGTIKCASGCDCACSTDETICSGSTPMCDATENVCTSCGAETPYYDGTMCVLNCPAEKPVYDSDNICQTCADIDSSTPLWDAENQTCVACAEGTEWNGEVCSVPCPNDTPYWNGSSCEACANGTYWNGTTCATLKEYCTAKMSGYDSSTYTVSDDGVITYTGNMSVNGDLTLTYCNLTVSGDLMVSSGTLTIGENRILKAQNVTAEHASSDGIVNNGTVEVSQNISGTSGGEYSGIENDGILLANGDVVGFSLDGTAIMNFGSLTATNMTGTGYAGIYNASDGFIIAKANIEGTAGPNVGVANEGTIKARGNLVGSSNQDVAISNYGTLEVSGDVVGTNISENTIGIGNAGLITATNAYYCKQIINEGQIIANINCNCEDSTQCEGPETTCTAQTPVLSGDTCVTCETADGSKPYYDGTACVAECPTGTTADENNICISETVKSCQEAMINAGFSSNDFTMEDTTIKCNFDVIVERDLDISGCNLEVDGMLTVAEEATLRANNVLVNGYTYGIDNAGTIDVVGDVTGAAMFGIVNNGMIKATTVTGMLSGGTFGGSGLLNNEVGTIMATNVYYCPTMNNLGKIIGKVNCGCSEGDSACGTIPATCSAEEGTPILLGDTCVSCATVDISKPVWDSKNQECVACAEGTGWIGTACGVLKEHCTVAMSDYDSANYTVSDDGVITYTGDMTIVSDLDVSGCDLVVSGALTLNEGKTVKVKNVTAGTKSVGDVCYDNAEGIYINTNAQLLATGNVNGCGSNHGVYNLGKLTGANMEVINGAVNYSGLYNENEIIFSGNITALGSGYVILNKNILTAKNITATLRGGASRAIFNSGTMTIENEIIGETISTMGSENVGIENSGILTAKKVTGIGAVVGDNGISNTGEIIATVVSGQVKSDEISGPIIDPVNLTIYSALYNGGTITADTIIGENPFESTNTNLMYVGLTNTTTGKMEASNVEYCSLILDAGTSTGTKNCNCSDATLCSTGQMTSCTDTSKPVLVSGYCFPCKAIDPMKPYWDSANSVCVATCPNGRPANPLTNVCR